MLVEFYGGVGFVGEVDSDIGWGFAVEVDGEGIGMVGSLVDGILVEADVKDFIIESFINIGVYLRCELLINSTFEKFIWELAEIEKIW